VRFSPPTRREKMRKISQGSCAEWRVGKVFVFAFDSAAPGGHQARLAATSYGEAHLLWQSWRFASNLCQRVARPSYSEIL
jgi:hypothetical protein